jgi:hypothetical protein
MSIRLFVRSAAEHAGGEGRPSPHDGFARYAALAALGLTFYPLVKGYSLGQVQTWVTALFAGVLTAWLAGRPGLAGVLAGVMCLIKPHYAILLPWSLIQRQWRFGLACAVSAGVGVAASLLVFGLADNVDYRRVLVFMARHGESYYPNHSLNGLLNRFLGNGPNLQFDIHAFAPFHPQVYLLTTLSAVGFSVLALLPWRRGGLPGVADASFVALSATLASPIAWEHHYGILLPVYAYLVPVFWARRKERPLAVALLAGSYVLASNYFGITRRFADAGPWWTLLQSYLLVAGLIVWALLLRILLLTRAARPRSPEAVPTAPG